MDTSIDLTVLASYADLIESGFADKDLPAEQRVEVVAALRRTMERAILRGSGAQIGRESARDHLLAACGEISVPAYARAIEIIRNI